MKVKVINKSDNALPSYATDLSAGMDVRAHMEAPVTLAPMQRTLIKTGLYFELPAGMEAQVRPRSGLALKKGLTVLNAPGTIDADYRGEVGVILINLSEDEVVIEPGERVAQIVFAQHATIEWEETLELSQSDRGAGGFGSTGIN